MVEIRDGIFFGKLGKKNHNHLPEPQRKEADQRRKTAKQAIREEPNKKQSKIVAEARKETTLEVIEKMGTDKALNDMIFRFKIIFEKKNH